MSDAIALPPHPNLEQYKKLARDLQHACKSSDPGAVRQRAARWVETLARLHDPANWPAARVRDVEAEQIERRWNKLKETAEPVAKCTLAGAQFFIAREHGFTSWPKFARHVEELARATSPVAAFEAAADAIVSGDVPTLKKLLGDQPDLVRERSTREHRSTLLHYVSANGVENFRQKTPKNIVEITKLLLDAGAEVDAESAAYGGCTALGLVATSIHPEQAGVQIPLLETLLDRGARMDRPSTGGNGHALINSCLANGQPGAAEFFACLGAPMDLEAAAALGRLDVVESYFDESGQSQAGREQLESAFLYACGYGRAEVVEFLLERGIHPSAHNHAGETALHWASWSPEIDVIKLLLERGAPVDAKDDRFHATPLDMALWTWNNTAKDVDRQRCYEAVALLARAGAKLDRDHWRDPGKDGSVMLGKIDSDLRMLAALRGDTP